VDSQLTLSDELRKLVEARLEQTLKGINDTLNQILEKQEITPKELKEEPLQPLISKMELGNSLHSLPEKDHRFWRTKKDTWC